jgi:hypothetical protein
MPTSDKKNGGLLPRVPKYLRVMNARIHLKRNKAMEKKRFSPRDRGATGGKFF